MQLLMLLVLTLFANSTVEQGQHIMQQVLTEARRNDEAKQHNLTFKRKKEVFVLDKQFIVKSRKQEEVARIMPRNGKSVEEIIERDGRPSNQRSEPGRFDVNIGELLAEVPKHVDFILNDTLSVDEDETRYLTLSMRPKVNPPRNRDRDDTFNALVGTMWIDLESPFIKKLDIRTSKRISWGWFGFVTLHNLFIEFEAKKRPDLMNIVVVESYIATYHYSIAGIDTYERAVYTYSDYGLVNPPQ